MQIGRRVAQILLVVATVIATLSVPTASAASPFVGRQGIGLNGIDFRSSSSAQQAQATRVAGTGAKWVRIEVDWWYVQDGGPTAYNWSGPDGAVAAAKAKSLNVLLLIQKTPPWARTTSDGSTPPTNPNDYATFAAKVVSRYAPQGVRSFEVWNEPNLWMFWADPVTGKPNVQGYVDLLKAAYPRMKAATTSAISIVAAGLSPYGTTGQSPEGHAISPITYLDQMYDLGAGPYFDAVGWHPYTAPALPNDTADWNAWSQMSIDFRNPDGTVYQKSARTIMIENGDAGKLIVMTEAGAATAGDPSVSERVQATAYRQAVDNRLSYSWAGPIFFYETTDRAAMTAVNPDKENYFGVYRSNGVAKPAVTVLKSVR